MRKREIYIYKEGERERKKERNPRVTDDGVR